MVLFCLYKTPMILNYFRKVESERIHKVVIKEALKDGNSSFREKMRTHKRSETGRLFDF